MNAKARPNHRLALDFGGFVVLASRSSSTCVQNLAETVANRALDFARVVGGHRPGEGSRTKRNFDQEPRRLALVDHRFETSHSP